MNLRLDLLRDDERRFEGPVSARFAVRLGVAMGVALALLAIGGSIYSYISTQSALASAQLVWKDLEPRSLRFKNLEKSARSIEVYERWITNWHGARLSGTRILEDIQEAVPPTIQLTRLNYQSSLDTRAEAGLKPSKTNPPSFRVRSTLTLEGQATGERAEETVNTLVNDLTNRPGFAPFLETFKLQRLDRDHTTGDRVFEVVVTFRPRVVR